VRRMRKSLICQAKLRTIRRATRHRQLDEPHEPGNLTNEKEKEHDDTDYPQKQRPEVTARAALASAQCPRATR
jgi:hypothetical protein